MSSFWLNKCLFCCHSSQTHHDTNCTGDHRQAVWTESVRVTLTGAGSHGDDVQSL